MCRPWMKVLRVAPLLLARTLRCATPVAASALLWICNLAAVQILVMGQSAHAVGRTPVAMHTSTASPAVSRPPTARLPCAHLAALLTTRFAYVSECALSHSGRTCSAPRVQMVCPRRFRIPHRCSRPSATWISCATCLTCALSSAAPTPRAWSMRTGGLMGERTYSTHTQTQTQLNTHRTDM